MNKLQRHLILIRAAQRLSPRMLRFMIRRVLRNRLARKFPNHYRARLAAIEAWVPEPKVPEDELKPGLLSMAALYCEEYRGVMDGACNGRFRLLDREVDFGAPSRVDWNYHVPDEGDHQLWRVKMSHMGVLCPMMIEGDVHHQKAAAALAKGALWGTDPTDPGAFDAYWFPYAASHRILSLTSGLIVAKARGGLPQETDASVTELLRRNVAFLLDNIEHELNNNHVERNLAALCLYFSYVRNVPSRIVAKMEREVRHLVETTVLPDGCQVERSPMYQGLSVTSLAVMAETPFLSEDLRALLMSKHEAAHRAFAILCHPDGQVALFNDSWHDEAPHYNGPPPPDGRSLLPQGGYARLSVGNDVCLLDAGPLGPPWNPGHGHADFLSVEITLESRRLIVDPGTSHYNTGPERTRERSAAAHNGPAYEGEEPVQFLDSFKVGRMAEARLLPVEKLPKDVVGGLFLSNLGRAARLVQHYSGKGFLVADLWKNKTTAQGRVSWLVPAEWRIVSCEKGYYWLEQNGAQAVIAPLIHATERTDFIPSHWATHYGRINRAYELLLHPRVTGQEQQMLCWIGHVPPSTSIVEDGQVLLDKLPPLITNSS